MEPSRVAGNRGVQGFPGGSLADPIQRTEGRADHRQVGGVGQQRLVVGRLVVQIDTANLGPGTTIGHYSVVASNVEIGKDCYIGHHVVIHPHTVIGDRCVIDDRSVVGKLPLRSAAMAIEPGTDLPPLAIGDGAILGTSAIVFRGSSIGSESLIADLASVREQTHIGDKTIIGRGTAIENHVSIGHRCKVEAGCFICAFSRIGDDCFVAPEVTFTNDSFLGLSLIHI